MGTNPNLINKIRNGLIAVNSLCMVLVTLIIFFATAQILNSLTAIDFLTHAGAVPKSRYLTLFFTFLLLILFLINLYLRENRFQKNEYAAVISCMIEVFISSALIINVNTAYKSILLLVIADVFICLKNIRIKIAFIILIMIIYIGIDFEFFSEPMKMVPLNEYLNIFTRQTRYLLAGCKSILQGVAETLFVVCIFLIVQREVLQKTRLEELNDQLRKSSEELKIANSQLSEYAARSEKIAETRERNRIAMEIHDTIGHSLTGIAAGLEACNALIDIDKERTKEQIRRISEAARKGLVDVRNSVERLKPDELERYYIFDAIENIVGDLNAVSSRNVTLDYASSLRELPLSAEQEVALYRVLQESTTNAVRHGNARNIAIRMILEESNLVVTIIDDGNCSSFEEGFGLTHMRERIELLGGTAEYACTSEGFRVRVSLPVYRR